MSRTPELTLPARAVLFDCDGVLVDSDASVLSAWSRWASAMGLDPLEVVDTVHGRRAADTVDLLVAADQRAHALELINRFEIEDAELVRACSGAPELMSQFARPDWAIVTSGTSALARARLVAARVPIAEVVVTADDVRNGKPDPEGYLKAAGSLGVAMSQVVVVEDSVAGVAAGRAAGAARVLGVGQRALHSDADVVVADLTGVRRHPDHLAISGETVLRRAREPDVR